MSVDKVTEQPPAVSVGSTALLGDWCVGVPDVEKGAQERFWCAYRGHNGTIYHKLLSYCNAHLMPLADSCCDAPASAKPVGDDGEYEWTGWHHLSCEQCDTQWTFEHEVIAWMRLPRFPIL